MFCPQPAEHQPCWLILIWHTGILKALPLWKSLCSVCCFSTKTSFLFLFFFSISLPIVLFEEKSSLQLFCDQSAMPFAFLQFCYSFSFYNFPFKWQRINSQNSFKQPLEYRHAFVAFGCVARHCERQPYFWLYEGNQKWQMLPVSRSKWYKRGHLHSSILSAW